MAGGRAGPPGAGRPGGGGGPGGAAGAAACAVDPELQVPARPIPRLRFPEDLPPGRFEREFAARSEPCIIEGLVKDWPALANPDRSWCDGGRWERLLGDEMLDCGFDPIDSRMMHFGDEEGEPGVLFNPGRLRLPTWAFVELGRLRQDILRIRRAEGSVDLGHHPALRARLNRELVVQNVPFLAVDENSPLHYFAPVTCRMRDLVPVSFYLSHDTFALPREMQEDLWPQAPKLVPGWGSPNSSRIWVTNGGPWTVPFPRWAEDSVPEPGTDSMIYSCFHCDRMENLHSLLAGEKRIVLVPPGQRDVLKATRFATQRQWLLAPVASHGNGAPYLGQTQFTSRQQECTSDQSAVHPLRPADVNRRATGGAWPDEVDFPVRVGRLRKGDTLYIPAYHWHWVATSTPPSLGLDQDGPLAISVNFWWWPIHNDSAMERWSFQNERESWQNARASVPADKPPLDIDSHALSFRRLTNQQRQEAAVQKSWPCSTVAAPSHVAAKHGHHALSVPAQREGRASPLHYEAVD